MTKDPLGPVGMGGLVGVGSGVGSVGSGVGSSGAVLGGSETVDDNCAALAPFVSDVAARATPVAGAIPPMTIAGTSVPAINSDLFFAGMGIDRRANFALIPAFRRMIQRLETELVRSH
ncbi:MAG: hypothetical protein ACOYD0_06005 [Candidatus Nanopelagicales bacterium]